MKLILGGHGDKTGRRELDCAECSARLEVKKVDVHELFEHDPLREYIYTGYFVKCPECGNRIIVKNEMENI